jgi:hypothetical protein
MPDSRNGRREFKRINSAILQFLLDGERGRNQGDLHLPTMAGPRDVHAT